MNAPPCVYGPDDWFAKPGTPASRRAMAVCMGCPLYWPCRDLALSEGIPEGIFGGMPPAERERFWQANGGKPAAFQQALDRNINPLLAERRFRETYDDRNPYEDEKESA